MSLGDRWAGHHIQQLTTPKVLAERAQSLGDKVFLNYLPDGRQLTYRDIDLMSNQLAHGLAKRGIGHGTHVACLMDNSPEQLLTYFALGKLGAVAVPLNTGSRGQSLQYLLSHSDAVALVVDDALWSNYAEVAAELDNIRQIVCLGADKAQIAARKTDIDVVDFADLYEADQSLPEATVSFNDPSYIIYTSGTTGPSKGVILTQAQCFLWGLSHAQAFGQRPDDIAYICLPMFHTNALQGATYNAIMVGASIALQKRFSASRFWQDIRACGATLTNLLGSMINILWSQPRDPADADNRLRMCMSAPIPDFGLEFEKRFGLRFIQSYSLTDFGPSHAYSLVEPLAKLGSCGKARAGIEARIVDENDFELEPGQRGELVLRHTMPWAHSQGYYKMPEATVKAWRNGWFHTGDVGVIDEDGYFWFLDRTKDAIRRRGENISAYEVEKVIMSHEAIRDVAVFAVKSEMSEDEVAAAITVKDQVELDHAGLIRYCQSQMAYYMVPRYLVVMQDLPRNSSQKVEKFKLRDWANEDLERLWDREKAGIVVKRG
ncbi:AMP-binding protein [Advenella alkanexedens]|uniref:AMP-binding protein n=1 Tax=Advenella alkanexedens TaxID=1481665 RepID=A0ABS6NLK7_9BURK|nr:AMP-binding protein [Advenella alkanexedens]MBV4396503.1 AMP-binding protein [Advenella alkanexedens]